MALKCDVCGENIHLKRINGKNDVIRCPLEKYKVVKSFYTKEFKQVISGIYQGDICQSNSPEGLIEFSKYIPEETEIMDYVKKYQNTLFVSSLIIQARKDTFFNHFNRFLMDIYDDNKIHFVDCTQEPESQQFNYLWLTPSNLRECYFKEGLDNMRFKSMSQLTIPSLVIYPIGGDSIEHKGWGDILLDMLTNRDAQGKPTWILKTKEFLKCQEVTSSEKLRSYLKASSNIPTLKLDIDDWEQGGDPKDMGVTRKDTEVARKDKSGTIIKGNSKVHTSSYGN